MLQGGPLGLPAHYGMCVSGASGGDRSVCTQSSNLKHQPRQLIIQAWITPQDAEPASPDLQERRPCLRALNHVGQEFSQINIYDIYVDNCLRGHQAAAEKLSEASGYHPGLLGPWAAAMGELPSSYPSTCIFRMPWAVSRCLKDSNGLLDDLLA